MGGGVGNYGAFLVDRKRSVFRFIPPDDLGLSLFSGFELTANIQYYNDGV